MRFLVALVAAVLLGGPTQLVGPAQVTHPGGGWNDAGNMSTDRGSGIIGVLLQSGRVLVTGVSGDDYAGLGNVDLYDPGRGWSSGPKLLGDPVGAAAAPLPGGGALLAGGVPFRGGTGGPGPGPVATAMVYDPGSATWNQVSNMSVARTGASASALPDGRVLVVGGYDRRVTQLPNPTGQAFCCLDIQYLPQAETEIFDPTSRTWTPGPSLAHGRWGHQAITLKGGRILVVGGFDSGNPGRPLDSAELLDPATGRWTAAGSIGAPRMQFTVTPLIDGRAILAGGVSQDGLTPLRSTLLFDPATNVWSPGADLANARSGHAAAVLRDGSVLVSGGADYLGRLASTERLDPSGSPWSPAGALPGARSDHIAISLPDGRVLVAGGRGPSGALKTSAMFDVSIAGAEAPDRAPGGAGSWRTAARPPLQTYQQTAQLLSDGRVLVLPQDNYESFSAELYDPASDAWTTPIARKSPRSMFVAAVGSDGRVLLLTLDEQRQTPGRAEVIDLKSGSVRVVASPGIGAAARLTLLPDGRFWLTPGAGGDVHSQVYDPASDRWSAGGDVPSDQQVQTVTPVAGGKVLVGGVTKAMVYDLASRDWTDAGTFPGYWTAYSPARLPSDDVLFIGGAAETTMADQRMLQVDAFQLMRWNHATGMLDPAHSTPLAAANASTAVLVDGTVLVAGGNPAIGGDPLPTAQIYNAATHSWSAAASLPVARAQASTVTLGDGRVLMVGGLGMFGGSAPSLLYVPQATIAAPKSPSSSGLAAAVGSVLIALAALLLAWQVVKRTRRRKRG
jgi:N-acetylneuraminic acid mutarotase